MKRAVSATGLVALWLRCSTSAYAVTAAVSISNALTGSVKIRATGVCKATEVQIGSFDGSALQFQFPPTTAGCAPDAVQVGNACVDKYEASVWQIAPSNTGLVAKVKAGTVTLADLTGGGAVPLGCNLLSFMQNPYPANFPANGQWTPVVGSSPPSPGVYAVSIPGVKPSGLHDMVPGGAGMPGLREALT